MNAFIQFLPLMLVLAIGYAIYVGVTRGRARVISEDFEISELESRSSEDLLALLARRYAQLRNADRNKIRFILQSRDVAVPRYSVLKGEDTLSRTFWLFCFLPAWGFNFVIGELMKYGFDVGVLPSILVSIIAVAYFSFMFRVLLRAGRHWTGNIIWKILALVAVALELFGSAAPILRLLNTIS